VPRVRCGGACDQDSEGAARVGRFGTHPGGGQVLLAAPHQEPEGPRLVAHVLQHVCTDTYGESPVSASDAIIIERIRSVFSMWAGKGRVQAGTHAGSG
jgi:hypothetical protein